MPSKRDTPTGDSRAKAVVPLPVHPAASGLYGRVKRITLEGVLARFRRDPRAAAGKALNPLAQPPADIAPGDSER